MTGNKAFMEALDKYERSEKENAMLKNQINYQEYVFEPVVLV